MRYSDYLKSEHWKSFKEKKSKFTKKRCAICADTNRVELHHLFYRLDLHNVETSDVRWLCRECHQTTHDLINKGILKFLKPNNHLSCFAFTKNAVKKSRGLAGKNLFRHSRDENVLRFGH